MYAPVRTVVWQGSAGDRRPYADQVTFEEISIHLLQAGFWTVQEAEADNYGCPNYAASHFELISLLRSPWS